MVVARDLETDGDYAAERLFLKFSKLRVPQPGDAILDVGCSTGIITAGLERLGLEPVGIDVVPEFIDVARERFPSIEFLVGEAEALPFPDASFDFVSLSSLIEHAADWRVTIRESSRVLKPGGVLYLSTSNRLWPRQGEIRHFWGFSYLPSIVQRKIYALAMKHRPELVGYTHLPAYHWLTWWQLAGELRRAQLDPHSWLQLLSEDDVPRHRRHQKGLIMAVLRFPIPLFPLLAGANLIVARKVPGEEVGASGAAHTRWA